MAKQRPGVMVYFSIRPSLKRLTLEEKGALFEAILDYGQTGVLPEFDGVLGIAWDFIQPLVDADGDAYQAKCEQAKKAIETRWARAKGDTDVYGGIRTNTEDTNYNNNINSNTITIPKSITKTMGEFEGEPTSPPLTKEIPKVGPLSEQEFEEKRQSQIAKLRKWTG